MKEGKGTKGLLAVLHDCYLSQLSGTISFKCQGDGVAFSVSNGDLTTVRGFHFDEGGTFNDLLGGEITEIRFLQGADNSPGHQVDAPMELILYQLAVGADENLSIAIDDVRRTGTVPLELVSQLSEQVEKVEEISEQIFVLREGVVTIGRSAECDIVVFDNSISRKHVEIRIADGKAKLVDLDSANGVRVNRKYVSEVELEDGNLIIAGNTVYRFMWAEGGIGVLFKMNNDVSDIGDLPTLLIPD